MEGALREGSDADPPYSMHRAIMFHGIVVVVAATLINLMEGRQVRRSADELAHAHREFVAGHEMGVSERQSPTTREWRRGPRSDRRGACALEANRGPSLVLRVSCNRHGHWQLSLLGLGAQFFNFL